MKAVRWNLVVSPEIDKSVRLRILSQGGGKKGDLSKFIEQAVRSYIFRTSVDEVKKSFSDMPEEELEALIDEAVQWARKDTSH